MARPTTTLLYASRRTIARADFRGSAPAGCWSRPRPDVPELVTAVEMAISLGPEPGRRVWVLATDLWTQEMSAPAAKVAGLGTADLAAALNFEAESHSGVSALEASLGYVQMAKVAGSRDFQFWLSQMPTADRDAIEDVVRRENSRLMGIAHPGGLPTRLTLPAEGGPFGRVELWPDAVVGVGIWQGPDAPQSVRIWNTDPASERWHAEVRHWRESGGDPERFEWLTADDYAPPPDIGAGVALNNDAALADWLSAWARALAARKPPVPVLRPVPRPQTTQARAGIAVALAVLAAGACIAAAYRINAVQADLEAAMTADQGKTQLLGSLRQEIDAKAAQRDKIKAERAKVEATTAKLVARRARYARLLEVLATAKPEDVLIRMIDQDGGPTRVSGLAVRPELADSYARRLFEALRPLGWEVQPPKTTVAAPMQTNGGGLWAFELVIRDTDAPRPPPPAATDGGN